ncbi:hypothetical protein J3R74_004183 [Puniceicoccus vermicola]
MDGACPDTQKRLSPFLSAVLEGFVHDGIVERNGEGHFDGAWLRNSRFGRLSVETALADTSRRVGGKDRFGGLWVCRLLGEILARIFTPNSVTEFFPKN